MWNVPGRQLKLWMKISGDLILAESWDQVSKNVAPTGSLQWMGKTHLSIFGDVAICGTTERSEYAPLSASPTVQLRGKREATSGTWNHRQDLKIDEKEGLHNKQERPIPGQRELTLTTAELESSQPILTFSMGNYQTQPSASSNGVGSSTSASKIRKWKAPSDIFAWSLLCQPSKTISREIKHKTRSGPGGSGRQH
ncbi:hypothetical protein B0H19DRAFT_1061233 [Mycena capillaripes]|nr:hypothetical protein B0H19DRAFT_1061233 [Mycena capillaripes]